MTDYTISSKLSNETVYACYRGRFWRWNGSIWKESRIMTHRFELARAADKNLTPQAFLTNGAEFTPLDEYEIDCAMLDALENAKPCKNAPIEPVEEEPECAPAQNADAAVTTAKNAVPTATAATPTTSESGADASASTPATSLQNCESVPAASAGDSSVPMPSAPGFDFSALGKLSEQAVETNQQFDLHYGTAQDEYLISCIYVAKMHALTAKAGRYGGGTWTKWYESKGMSKSSVWNMLQTGEGFKGSTVEQLTSIPELSRKDLNLIARSGCAEQLTAAAGDSQRVQELLAQLKAEKERADAAEKSTQNARKENAYFKELVKNAEAQTSKDAKKREEAESRYESALADISGLKEQNDQLKERADSAEAREEEAWKMQSKAETRAQEAEKQLEGSRQMAEAAKLRGDKLKAENDALKKQPITMVVDKEEVERQAREMAAEMTADLRAQLEQASSGIEQDAHSSYDNVLLADRSLQNIGKMVVPSLRRLPPEQREQLTNMLVHTLGQIQGEVSRCL